MNAKRAGSLTENVSVACRSSRMSVSHATTPKSHRDDWVPLQLVDDTKMMGHDGPLVFRSGLEPALLKVFEGMALLRN